MTIRAWVLTAGVPLAAACSHASQAAKAEAPPPVASAAPEPASAPVPAAPMVRSCSGDEQCATNELCLSGSCAAITAGLSECKTSAHFDFDRAEVHPNDLPSLRRAARCLNALPEEKTLIEGNCDERGTVQYNVALGFRRAHATAKYMEDLGVPAGRVSEVSYGKELPLCTDSTESCWSMNRRADVTPGAKAKDVAGKIRADERREGSKRTAAAGRRARPAAQARRPGSTAPAAETATPAK